MKISIFLFSLFIFNLTNIVTASTKDNELAVHLLSYLAQDYGEAVQDGKVKSIEEYQEQLDFAKEVVRISEENNYNSQLKNSILKLNNGILNKLNPEEISNMANTIKTNILNEFQLLTFPSLPINISKAHQLYQENCMACHGQGGYGDGAAGKGLEPKPTNFHDLERMQNVSPYGAFNTISLGVNGTGMASHDYLTEEDRWSLAYYVTSFRFKNIKKIEGITLSIKDSSSLSDNEIKVKFGLDDEKSLGVLASIRDNSSNPPSDGKKNQLELHLTEAIKKLKESLNLYLSGEVKEARNLSLTAYLQDIEPIEGILKANNKDLVSEIELTLSKYRSLLANNASEDEITSILYPLISKLENVIQSKDYDNNNVSSFLMSFGIVLREAFEAGLILFLLFSLTKKSNATVFNKHIHFGWISSLLVGIVLYLVIDNAFKVTGEIAESLEGYTALIASGLLFYVGFWMHKNMDINKLKDSLVSAVNNATGSKKGLALFLVAFTAVFREVFETLLFIKILLLDGHSKFYVGFGAVIALALTFIVIKIAIRYSIRLNLSYLFKASTVLILVLSTIFLGKGIGALQKTGSFVQTSLDIYSIPVIGFNSTLEVLIAQMGLVIIICSYVFLKFKNEKLA